jgi:quaternary ammonium compound-resistance protein SugE
MAWLYLIMAGMAEVGWAIGLKFTEGFTRPLPSIATVATMVVSFYLLSQALRTLPIGTAYAVWTGIGAVGTALLGMAFFDEPRSVLRLLSILLIILGIIGLRFLGAPPA